MKWLLTHRAWQDYQDAPASVQKAFDKQVGLLAENLRHPSLRAKKYDQATQRSVDEAAGCFCMGDPSARW